MRSRFHHTQSMYKRNWNCSCLVNSIYFAQHIFQIHYLLHCVDESWWNMPFKETRLGDGVADDAIAMLLPLWLHAAALWCHAVWIRIVTSNNAWMGKVYSSPNWIAQERFTNIILTPSKQWGVCDKTCEITYCLFNSLFRRTTEKTSKFCIAAYPPVASGFSSQWASNVIAESCYISGHHEIDVWWYVLVSAYSLLMNCPYILMR